MKRYVLFFFSVFFFITIMSQAGEIERIKKSGVITVSLNRDYPPFSMQESGKIFGLDVDLANLLASHLKVKVQFIRPDTYDQQIPKLVAGEADIIMAAMTKTLQRAMLVNFSTPYFEVSQAALVRRDKVTADAKAYFDLLSIKDIRLGVKAGTTHEDFARQLFPATAIKVYPSAAAAAEAVVQGDVDAMVADSPFVQVWHNTHIEHYTSISALLEPVTREFYAFAIRKGDQDFLTWLNVFVDEIKNDGTLDLLVHEYFEQMNWARGPGQAVTRQNRAEFLKNRFIIDKKVRIEQRRRAFQGRGANFE
jgi:polar amino acid transport system substrate-binding protein